jgi:hypothetical protein
MATHVPRAEGKTEAGTWKNEIKVGEKEQGRQYCFTLYMTKAAPQKGDEYERNSICITSLLSQSFDWQQYCDAPDIAAPLQKIKDNI